MRAILRAALVTVVGGTLGSAAVAAPTSPASSRLVVKVATAATAATAASPIEEAERLLWAGRIAEAEALLVPLAGALNPEGRVLLRLAQARRWSGRPWSAIQLLEKPAQTDPSLREELATAWMDVGRPGAARSVLGEVSASAAVAELLQSAGTVEVTTSSVAFDDSFGASGILGRTVLSARLPGDVRLRAGGSVQRLLVPSAAASTQSAGAELEIPAGALELRGAWGIHRDGEALRHEARVGAALALTDGLRVEATVRRRPFVSPAPLLGDGVRSFYGAGSGGAYDLTGLRGRGLDEASLSVAFSPAPPIYTYLGARGFSISDGNRGFDVAGGLGVELLSLFGVRSPFAIAARWDSFLMSHALQTAAYFSPALMETHAASAELRWRLEPVLAVMAEGGATFAFGLPGQYGALAGGGLELTLGWVRLAARGQWRNDVYFSSRRAWAELSFRW